MSALAEKVRARRRAFSPALARAIREAADVSQREIAHELGVHRVSVTRWELGTRRPSGVLLEAYLDLLEELRGV